jgi:hypothetical protein
MLLKELDIGMMEFGIAKTVKIFSLFTLLEAL